VSNQSVARESAPQLVGGPYSRPTFRGTGRHRDVFCLVRGVVRAEGITAAPIPWPYVSTKSGRKSLLLSGDLIAALHVESPAAIMHHWGVSSTTVMRWREALRHNLRKGTRGSAASRAARRGRHLKAAAAHQARPRRSVTSAR
jgi:hypothetical protein